MNGALPPSSSATFFTVEAAWRIKSLPISVEPVKAMQRTNGLVVISSPMADALPVMTLKTPAGAPARSAHAASPRAVSGVWLAGLQTTVQPAASAGVHLRVIIAAGKFHGVIAPTTPIGCLM